MTPEYAQKIQEAKDRANAARAEIIECLRHSGAVVDNVTDNRVDVDGVTFELTSGVVTNKGCYRETDVGLIEWRVGKYVLDNSLHRHPERKSGGWDTAKIVSSMLAKVQEYQAVKAKQKVEADRQAASHEMVKRLRCTHATSTCSYEEVRVTTADRADQVKVTVHCTRELSEEQAGKFLQALKAAGLTIGGKPRDE